MGDSLWLGGDCSAGACCAPFKRWGLRGTRLDPLRPWTRGSRRAGHSPEIISRALEGAAWSAAENTGRERILARIRAALREPAPKHAAPAVTGPVFAPIGDPLERFQKECAAE